MRSEVRIWSHNSCWREFANLQLHRAFFQFGCVRDVVEQAQHGSRYSVTVPGGDAAGASRGVEQRLGENR